MGWSIEGHPSGILQVRPGTAARSAGGSAGADNRVHPEPRPDGPTQTVGTRTPPGPETPTSGPGGSTSTAAALPPPARISIPSLSVDAPVLPEGVAADGQMAIPKRIDTIGWYKWGPAPGAGAGSIVMVGHVDSAIQGTGAFFTLRNIDPGALVTVTSANHRIHHYRVIAREEFPKTSVPLAAIFARTGRPRLTLATCGGSFNRATHSYTDNIVITALPM